MSYDPHDPTVDNRVPDPHAECEDWIAKLNHRIDEQQEAHNYFIKQNDRFRAALRTISCMTQLVGEDGWQMSRRLKRLAWEALYPNLDPIETITEAELIRRFGP
jgi:hypothetical protein